MTRLVNLLDSTFGFVRGRFGFAAWGMAGLCTYITAVIIPDRHERNRRKRMGKERKRPDPPISPYEGNMKALWIMPWMARKKEDSNSSRDQF